MRAEPPDQNIRFTSSKSQYRFLTVFVLMACLWGVTDTSTAAEKPTIEYQVKASYIYNFLQFIEWPPETAMNSEVTICLLGKDRFGPALDTLDGESLHGFTLSIRRLKTPPDGLDDCQVVFISTADRTLESMVLNRLANRPVLTIGENPGFSDRGGIINLIQIHDKIRFEINQQAAARAQLKISAQLLQLAVRK